MMSFSTLVGRVRPQQTCPMNDTAPIEKGPDMPGYTWAALDEAPVRQLFPGIRARPLWVGADGATAHVLEMAPGSHWEGIDVHEPGPEEVFVVSGTFDDGVREYPAGSFIHAPAGSWHVPQTATGCTLFVFYPEG